MWGHYYIMQGKVDSTMLVSLVSITDNQAKITEETTQAITQILD